MSDWSPFDGNLTVVARRVCWKGTHIKPELRGKGLLGEWNGMQVVSESYPAISANMVCLLGTDEGRDQHIAETTFPTKAEAVNYYNRATSALNHVCADLIAKHEVEVLKAYWEATHRWTQVGCCMGQQIGMCEFETWVKDNRPDMVGTKGA